ncbi:unnamed protein product [Phytomonas sp. Hart1]|nr:unnamed protein product [Phytomonas sp. Hart1]|eukprot:CCW67267.1 unnamed protein product [Phytomonas sp. isolate Hart1]
MRRFYDVLIWTHVNPSISRYFSTEFFQLFGRHPTSIPPSRPQLEVTTKTIEHVPPISHSLWKEQLKFFENEVYSNPNSVDNTVCLNTLKCFSTFLSHPAHRRSVAVEMLWKKALEVLSASHIGGEAVVQNMVYTAFILYYSRKYLECKELTYSALGPIFQETSTELTSLPQYQAFLQLLSLYVLSGMQVGHRIDTKAQLTSTRLLSESVRKMRNATNKSEQRLVASSILLLLYSYDWVYHFLSTTGQSSANGLDNSFVMRLRSLGPSWAKSLFQNSPQSTREVVSAISQQPQRSPPSLFFITGRQAETEGDVNSLRILLQSSIKMEEAFPNIRVFGMSVLLADIFMKIQKRGGALAERALDYAGGSLSAETLAIVGDTSWGYKKAIYWLTEMRGPEAYFALKKILFHKDPSVFAELQESHGDVLTGKRGANWKAALAQINSSLSFADSTWRRQLPTTLRLLSDADRKKEFFDLIREYDLRDGTHNLMVAASLAQMLRRSGKWYHYNQVIDLIAASNIPQSEEGDGFLKEACLQTIYALRNANRWEEALSTYALMRSVMPAQVHRLLCFMICGMPPSSPWQNALQTLSAVAPVPPECLKTLACMYGDDDEVPQTPRERKYILHGLIRVGRWETLLKVAKANPDEVECWIAFFKASEACGCVVPYEASLLRQTPLSVWRDERVLKQAFLSSFANGFLKELDEVLEEISGQCSLSKEVSGLIRFLVHGRTSKGTQISDSYLGHCYTSFVSAFKGKICVSIDPKVSKGPQPSSTDRRGDLAAWFKVPEFCIARAQSGSDTSYYLQPFPLVNTIPKQLFYANSEIVIGYKPIGASIQSVARGVLRFVDTHGTYRIGFLIAPSASGLFLLRKSVIGVKNMELTLQIEMELIPCSVCPSPLLSAKFFARYKMVFLDRSKSEGVVKLLATLSRVPLASANDMIRNLKMDLNSEGWTFVEEDVDFGDSYRVRQLNVLDLHLGKHSQFTIPSSRLKNYSH